MQDLPSLAVEALKGFRAQDVEALGFWVQFVDTVHPVQIWRPPRPDTPIRRAYLRIQAHPTDALGSAP